LAVIPPAYARFSPLARLKVLQFIQLYKPFSSPLALSPLMNNDAPVFHAAKISEINRVFLFTFLAENNFVAADI